MPVKKTKAKAAVDPEKWYTLSDIAELRLFPWCGTDLRRYRRVVLADLKDANHLKTVKMGDGRTTRYQMKGSNITSFIMRVEAGEIRL